MRGTNRQALLLSSCLVGLLGRGKTVNAEGVAAAKLPLAFPGCEPSEAREIGRLVAIDLGGTDELIEPGVRSVVITCQDGRFDIAAARAGRGDLARSIDLRRAPPSARSRIVAIAVVELMAADAMNSPPPPLIAPAPVPTADTTPKPPTKSPCCTLHIEATGSGRTFVGGIPRLLGGGVRGVATRGIPLGFDALFEYGDAGTSEGTVHVFSLTMGATLGWSIPLGDSTFRAAGGWRGGAAKLSGQPIDPVLVQAEAPLRGWGGPMIEAGITLRPAPPLVVEFSLESGYVMFPIDGLVSGQRELALRGAWIGFQLGMGIGL